MEFPAGLKYTKDHEWAKVDGKRVTVGITAFAVEQLGDITLVTIDAKVGDQLAAGKTFGTIESVKTLSDLYAPINGKVVEVNGSLDASPEKVNEDPYQAWMIVLETDGALDGLMDQAAYQAHVKESAH